MLNKSRDNTVYLEGGNYFEEDDGPEAIPIEKAEYSVYTDGHGEWLLLLVECPDWRHIELGIPLPQGLALKDGAVLNGVAYDEAFGGWLTNMYYYTHFGVESVTLTVRGVDEDRAVFVVTGDISSSGIRQKTISFTTTATLNPDLRKSFG
jgi:hypothetical protein